MQIINLISFKNSTFLNDVKFMLTKKNIDFCVVTPDDFFDKKYNPDFEFCVVINKNLQLRKKIINELNERNLKIFTIVDKNALVDSTAIIGEGSIVCAFSYVTSNVKIGEHNIISPFCFVGHNSITGSGVILNPNSLIAGSTLIGNFVKMNLKASVIDQIEICDFVEIGATSTITKNVNIPGFYVGTPARKVKSNNK